MRCSSFGHPVSITSDRRNRPLEFDIHGRCLRSFALSRKCPDRRSHGAQVSDRLGAHCILGRLSVRSSRANKGAKIPGSAERIVCRIECSPGVDPCRCLVGQKRDVLYKRSRRRLLSAGRRKQFYRPIQFKAILDASAAICRRFTAFRGPPTLYVHRSFFAFDDSDRI